VKNNKISFAVENVEMIDSNKDSNFAVLSLDFFASGSNLHNMYVSENTLMRTADTIKNCPIVWAYDEKLDDIYTHTSDEVPCGFVPETSTVTSRVLEDGRTMLSTVAYVWKRYTGELLSFFKRDGGKKPVSVEMTVYNTRKLPNDKLELTDFRYEGITILGSFITPAIPLAQARVLSFSDIKNEYMEDLENEFPTKYVEMGTGMLVTFPYKSISEINPALKGIDPPITLAQANAIARQAEAIGTDGKVNGWAIAIASFKKTHVVKNGRWVRKKQNMFGQNNEQDMEEILGQSQPEMEENFMKIKQEELGEITAEAPEAVAETVEEVHEAIEEPLAEAPNANIEEMAVKIGELSKTIEKMSKEIESYKSENEELKKFKASIEASQKAFAIEQTIRELEEKVIIPEDKKSEMIADAENYSFSQIEEWKTLCKAKSFDFVAREGKDSSVGIKRAGLPFGNVTAKSKNDLWQ